MKKSPMRRIGDQYQHKLTKFMEAMAKVIKMSNVVVLTDTQLRTKANSLLKREDRVGLSTFEAWKGSPDGEKSLENQTYVDQEEVEDFRFMMELFRVDGKLALADKALSFEKGQNSQGAMTMLSRIFTDMRDSEPQGKGNSGTTINITVGNPDHKKLIDDILTNTIDVTPETKELNE